MSLRRLMGLCGLALALGACDEAATSTPSTLDAYPDATSGGDSGPGPEPDAFRPVIDRGTEADVSTDASADASASDATSDSTVVDDMELPPPGPDLGPDVGVPAERLGRLGEACARGAALDCDPEVAPECVFVGENEVLPGVSAVCSRACDDAAACGEGQCCAETADGGRCLPAGFCADQDRGLGDACQRDADCPADAPVCGREANTGDRFCTTGCASGDECPEGFCCDANAGGRPEAAICKPEALCPPRCALDADCPAVQYCDAGACVPRSFSCQVDLDCPIGEQCVDGNCKGETLRLGEECELFQSQCGEGAPICVGQGDGVDRCTYGCSFDRECPATFCCADLAGLGDPSGYYCTAVEGACPRNRVCVGDDECSADQFCHMNLCQRRGPGDVPRGGLCDRSGDCEDPDTQDCVFGFPGGVGRGDRESFENPAAGICGSRCNFDVDCLDGECCRVALQAGASVGAGFCAGNGICGGGGVPIGPPDPEGGCRTPSQCDPSRFDRCIVDRFFGAVCSTSCARGCPGGYACDPRDEQCHPVNVCDGDGDCGGGNRCIEGRCVEGARQCNEAVDCGDPVALRCVAGRCADRARPCGVQADCDADELCFDGECELAERPCAADDECRFGERCLGGICGAYYLGFGDACADDVEFGCDPVAAPICFIDPAQLDGACTTSCAYGSDCPGASVCIDREGIGDPAFFLCAPEDLADRAAGVPGHRPCAADGMCLTEDFCHHGACQDAGDGAADVGADCQGPGDCNLMTSDACVVAVDAGFVASAVGGLVGVMGATCQPSCNGDGDCGAGCCRHAVEGGRPVGYCVPDAFCAAPVGGPGEPCFPGAHEECDPATTDACVFGPVTEEVYCAQGCNEDADCDGGCCGDTDAGRFCLAAGDCPAP